MDKYSSNPTFIEMHAYHLLTLHATLKCYIYISLQRGGQAHSMDNYSSNPALIESEGNRPNRYGDRGKSGKNHYAGANAEPSPYVAQSKITYVGGVTMTPLCLCYIILIYIVSFCSQSLRTSTLTLTL
jgi:hypothetical protein